MQHVYQIIIVEDNAALASLLIGLIRQHYPTAIVQTCDNGQVALEAYSRAKIDLLLVNHRLTGMDGPAIIRTLRAHGDTLPIIAMPGSSGAHEYMAAGVMAYIDDGVLIEQLSALLRGFRLPTRYSVRHVGQMSGE